jgi:hypothetical protein
MKVVESRENVLVSCIIDFRQIASLTGQCRQVYCLVEFVWKWCPPRHRCALHTNGVSSTASHAGENDQTIVDKHDSFWPFQHIQPSEVAEEDS